METKTPSIFTREHPHESPEILSEVSSIRRGSGSVIKMEFVARLSNILESFSILVAFVRMILTEFLIVLNLDF